MVTMNISDSELFSKIDIGIDNTFKDLIQNLSNYVYNEIELDSVFGIEDWLEKILDCEAYLSITKKRHRDHLLHACRIAILGEKILKQEMSSVDNRIIFLDIVRELIKRDGEIKSIFLSYGYDINDEELLNKAILQIWYVAALFHDIGYVYESFIGSWRSIEFLKNYPDFKELYLDIEKALTKFKKEFYISPIHNSCISSKFTRDFDHARISACVISNLVKESNPICDVAAIIADNHTSNENILFSEDPLSFLLVLLDEVQEWERPVMGKKLRDQILSEKINKLSPFIEHMASEPHLNLIQLKIDFDKNEKNDAYFKIDFDLNFEDNTNIISDTSFCYPMMLYLKYKNFQRLKIGNENGQLDKAYSKCDKTSDPSKFYLCISFKLKSDGALSFNWHRQCNILFFKTLEERNLTISNWLDDITNRRRDLIEFNIENDSCLTKRFSGDFKDVIMSAHDTYLRDLDIIEDESHVECWYEELSDPNIIKWKTKITKYISNSDQGLPIYGIYASYDENFFDYNLDEVKVDDLNIKGQVFPFKILQKGVETYEYQERFAMFIPFGQGMSALHPQKTKKVDYTVSMAVPLKNMQSFSGIFNVRQWNIKEGSVIVHWDKSLFDKLFKCAISFEGSSKDYDKMLEYIKVVPPNSLENEKDIEKFIAYMKSNYSAFRNYYSKYNSEDDNEYKFEYNFKNLKPRNGSGFAWAGCLLD